MTDKDYQALEAENKQLKARLANADKVIRDISETLNKGDISSIWGGSPLHQQVELYLNPVIIDEEQKEAEQVQLRA